MSVRLLQIGCSFPAGKISVSTWVNEEECSIGARQTRLVAGTKEHRSGGEPEG